MKTDSHCCAEAAAVLSRTHSLLVITGAGISAESGLRTYNGPGGVYTVNPSLTNILSAEGWAEHRQEVWEYINQFRAAAAAAKPNPAHEILARWELEGRFQRILVATQNIDGLHQKAGSRRVSEVHGSVWQVARILRQNDLTEDDEPFADDIGCLEPESRREEILRRWSEENDQEIWQTHDVPFRKIPPFNDPAVRPNIVFFDESYGKRLLWVQDFIRNAPDTVLVVGCSGIVALLSWLLHECRVVNPDCQIINVNPHEDCVSLPHIHIPLPAGLALAQLDEALKGCQQRRRS